MENRENLLQRFESLKKHLTEQWQDSGIKTPPTDKEVWGQLRAIAMQRKEEALADDMEGYVIMYQKRIKLIDEELKNLEGKTIDELAEMHKAVNRYEQGLGID